MKVSSNEKQWHKVAMDITCVNNATMNSDAMNIGHMNKCTMNYICQKIEQGNREGLFECEQT